MRGRLDFRRFRWFVLFCAHQLGAKAPLALLFLSYALEGKEVEEEANNDYYHY